MLMVLCNVNGNWCMQAWYQTIEHSFLKTQTIQNIRRKRPETVFFIYGSPDIRCAINKAWAKINNVREVYFKQVRNRNKSHLCSFQGFLRDWHRTWRVHPLDHWLSNLIDLPLALLFALVIMVPGLLLLLPILLKTEKQKQNYKEKGLSVRYVHLKHRVQFDMSRRNHCFTWLCHWILSSMGWESHFHHIHKRHSLLTCHKAFPVPRRDCEDQISYGFNVESVRSISGTKNGKHKQKQTSPGTGWAWNI